MPDYILTKKGRAAMQYTTDDNILTKESIHTELQNTTNEFKKEILRSVKENNRDTAMLLFKGRRAIYEDIEKIVDDQLHKQELQIETDARARAAAHITTIEHDIIKGKKELQEKVRKAKAEYTESILPHLTRIDAITKECNDEIEKKQISHGIHAGELKTYLRNEIKKQAATIELLMKQMASCAKGDCAQCMLCLETGENKT